MNTEKDGSLQKRQAIENIRNELHKIYWEHVGKEPDPEILWAEAEDFVAKHGPNAGLEDLF